MWAFPTKALPRSTSSASQRAAVLHVKGRCGVKLALWLSPCTVSSLLPLLETIMLPKDVHNLAMLVSRCSCMQRLWNLVPLLAPECTHGDAVL